MSKDKKIEIEESTLVIPEKRLRVDLELEQFRQKGLKSLEMQSKLL